MQKSFAGLHRVTLLGTFRSIKGFMYGAPIPVGGDTNDMPRHSKLVLFEDGVPLRRSHEQHSSIAGTGRGAYSHWGSRILFSTSDNTDPNRNGRVYSYGIDHAAHYEADEKETFILGSPFHAHGGFCWGITVSEQGDHVGATASRLKLLEDGRPIGPAHTDHLAIERVGGGAYSHWQNYLYFSTSDGSDPNTNGRLYSYDMED